MVIVMVVDDDGKCCWKTMMADDGDNRGGKR